MFRGRQGGRRRAMERRWGRGADTEDKDGTSQIGNISFQHVLTEHFICERRNEGGGSDPTVQRPVSVQRWNRSQLLCSSRETEMWWTALTTPATHPQIRREHFFRRAATMNAITWNLNRTVHASAPSQKDRNWCTSNQTLFLFGPRWDWIQMGHLIIFSLSHLWALLGFNPLSARYSLSLREIK